MNDKLISLSNFDRASIFIDNIATLTPLGIKSLVVNNLSHNVDLTLDDIFSVLDSQYTIYEEIKNLFFKAAQTRETTNRMLESLTYFIDKIDHELFTIDSKTKQLEYIDIHVLQKLSSYLIPASIQFDNRYELSSFILDFWTKTGIEDYSDIGSVLDKQVNELKEYFTNTSTEDEYPKMENHSSTLKLSTDKVGVSIKETSEAITTTKRLAIVNALNKLSHIYEKCNIDNTKSHRIMTDILNGGHNCKYNTISQGIQKTVKSIIITNNFGVGIYDPIDAETNIIPLALNIIEIIKNDNEIISISDSEAEMIGIIVASHISIELRLREYNRLLTNIIGNIELRDRLWTKYDINPAEIRCIYDEINKNEIIPENITGREYMLDKLHKCYHDIKIDLDNDESGKMAMGLMESVEIVTEAFMKADLMDTIGRLFMSSKVFISHWAIEIFKISYYLDKQKQYSIYNNMHCLIPIATICGVTQFQMTQIRNAIYGKRVNIQSMDSFGKVTLIEIIRELIKPDKHEIAFSIYHAIIKCTQSLRNRYGNGILDADVISATLILTERTCSEFPVDLSEYYNENKLAQLVMPNTNAFIGFYGVLNHYLTYLGLTTEDCKSINIAIDKNPCVHIDNSSDYHRVHSKHASLDDKFSKPMLALTKNLMNDLVDPNMNDSIAYTLRQMVFQIVDKYLRKSIYITNAPHENALKVLITHTIEYMMDLFGVILNTEDKVKLSIIMEGSTLLTLHPIDNSMPRALVVHVKEDSTICFSNDSDNAMLSTATKLYDTLMKLLDGVRMTDQQYEYYESIIVTSIVILLNKS